MNPAIFLDRDGVIIENQALYVRNWADVILFPQALQALVHLNLSPFKIIIVTNQSAIGRGIITHQQADAINERLLSIINLSGGRIDGIYLCPHAPEEHCTCRKPQPGLILKAAGELSIDLSQSIIIGDAWSDLLAGKRAGVSRLVLVKTGRGIEQATRMEPEENIHFEIYADLKEAVANILQQPITSS
jgi:D-glycero-D-manno-heptose 1,7-bisphosphate phosphatase